MEPLRWTGTVHTVLRSVYDPIATRNVRAPSGMDEAAAMHFVRFETYSGGYITEKNGRPGPLLRAEFRKWIKEGVLNITVEQGHEIHLKGQKARAYYSRLQRELEYFEGPFEWKYGHEGNNG